MRVFLALLLLISPSLLLADDPSMPPGDQRAIRELQDKAYGSPSLPTGASSGESLLALAALGSEATQPGDQTLQADDYAALLALLQRYRDDLLKMGMDSSELQAQLSILEVRTKELEARLDALQPKDGLKIYGRFYSLYDDLQVLGPGYIPQTNLVQNITPGSYGKQPNQGIRTMIGQAHAELSLEGTRGAVTGYAQMDVVMPWGENVGMVGLRKVDVEMRLPITFEAGDLDASLTPLTLWRNDSYQPFQPSIFSERYQRMQDDLLLKPNDWPFTGARASTDALLFNSVTLHMQYLVGTVGNAAGSALVNYAQEYVYLESPSVGGYGLLERYNTYMQGWMLTAPMLQNRLNLGYEGLEFFDVASTAPGSGAVSGYMPMNEAVQSVSADYKSDHFVVDGEAAASNYQAPWINDSIPAAQGPLTGTALTADGTWKGDNGYLKVFGRYVSSGFHAAGAQGRTVDYAYQFLGPFLTENSQIGANGTEGLEGNGAGGIAGANIPLSNASRLNDQLIPPGVYTGSSAPGGVWQNLLAYGPGEEIDPYGAATPNLAGVGVEATYKFFNGILTPLASAESFQELDPMSSSMGALIDPTGNTFTPFSMSRYRGGLMLDLAPMINFPLRVGGGLTMTDAENGQQVNGISNNMSTQTTDISLQWNAGHPVGIQAGYRQMMAQGQDETFVFKPGGETWDITGLGVWWRPSPTLSVDVTTTLGHTIVADNPAAVKSSVSGNNPESGNLQWTENLVRVTLEF
jgi:hypothetical protein